MSDKTRLRLPAGFFLFLCVIVPLIYLTPLATHPLLEPDEGRYAEIPREMLESGDFITPKLNYVHYFEKPALLYWANAASFKLFGENEFAARFPSALAALGGIIATGLLASALFGRRCGLLAATILGTSLLYVAIGTINLTDMPLSCFVTLTMASFYADVRFGGRRYRLLFYVATALGVLTKGLVAIVIPGGVLLCYIVLCRKWSLIRRFLYVPGILAFLGLTVPWFYLVCRENPDFFHFFFIQEHFLRYATTIHDRYEPFWYFVPILFAGTMPWTPCLFGLFGKEGAIRKPESPQTRDANIFLLLWFCVIFLFFSASGSKLIPYVVPCLPPLAILMASALERAMRADAPPRFIRGCIATNIIFSIALFGYAIAGGKLARSEALGIAAALSAGLVLGAILALREMRRQRRDNAVHRAVLALCVGALLFALGLQAVYIPLGRTRSIEDVARAVLSQKEQGRRIAVYGEILQTMPFYAKERVVLIDYTGELAFGASKIGEADKKEWFPSRSEFLEAWNAGIPYALVVKKRRLEQLFPENTARNTSMETESGDYLIFFN